MLDGLEASEIKYSNLNPEFRVDAEYHKKAYLREDSQRSKYLNLPLGQLAFITDGQHGYHEVDENSSLVLLTAKNAKNWFADKIGADRVAQWVDDKNKRSSLKVGDIIVSTRGSVGYCAIVAAEALPANIDQDIARVAIESKEILPEFALAYLNCAIGQDWMNRNATGMVQQGLSLAKLRELPLPLLSKEFQKATQTHVRVAQQKLEQSKALYAEAESLLLDELELKDWQPSEESVAVKSFAESFSSTGRLDAEYYQPKYDELEHFLRENFIIESIGSWGKILKGMSLEYTNSNDGVPVIRSGDLSDIEDEEKFLRASQGQKMFFVKKGDVLISSIGFGSIGKVQVFDKQEAYATVSEVTVIRQKRINPYYLHFYLRCSAGQMQIEHYITGATGQLHLYPKDVGNILVPIVDQALETKLESLFIESRKLKQQSRTMLDIAKRGVEMAIEEDERAALVWMEKEADSVLRA